MNIGQYLTATAATLKQAGIESARLDTLILLEDALNLERSLLLAHPEREIPAKTLEALNKKIARRVKHIPLAYIRGTAPFYGRDFAITPGVLVPRPETESMLALYKTLSLNSTTRVADVGTGSGCIGITIALESPGAQIDLYDIDPVALGVAVTNAHTLHVTARFYTEDLLSGANSRRYDVVCANLPYVPDDYPINDAAKHEPALALFAGADGLDLYRLFFEQLAAFSERPGYVLTESLPQQHTTLAHIAKTAGYELSATDGYVQLFAA